MTTESFSKSFEIKDPAIVAKLLHDIENPVLVTAAMMEIASKEKASQMLGDYLKTIKKGGRIT